LQRVGPNGGGLLRDHGVPRLDDVLSLRIAARVQARRRDAMTASQAEDHVTWLPMLT